MNRKNIKFLIITLFLFLMGCNQQQNSSFYNRPAFISSASNNGSSTPSTSTSVAAVSPIQLTAEEQAFIDILEESGFNKHVYYFHDKYSKNLNLLKYHEKQGNAVFANTYKTANQILISQFKDIWKKSPKIEKKDDYKLVTTVSLEEVVKSTRNILDLLKSIQNNTFVTDLEITNSFREYIASQDNFRAAVAGRPYVKHYDSKLTGYIYISYKGSPWKQ